jgi:hypothetical protein
MKQKSMSGISTIKLVSTALVGLLVGSTIFGGFAYTLNKDLQDAQNELMTQTVTIKTLNENLNSINERISELTATTEDYATEIETLKATETELKTQLETYTLELTEKDKAILELEAELEGIELELEETEFVEVQKYTKDEIALDSSINFTLSDRNLDILFDGEYTFDKEDYNAEEVFTVNNLNVDINKEDFEADVYLSMFENSIEYTLQFEDGLNTSLIDSDDTLEIKFLGEDYTITNWDNTEITFSKGTSYLLNEKEMKVIDENEITPIVVGANFAYISVNGDAQKIDVGNSKMFGDIEIKVEEVIPVDDSNGFVEIIVGKEVSEKIISGYEYSEDSVWNWKITSNSIGITLNEQFVDLDDEFQPLKAGTSFMLPNEYLTLNFDGIMPMDIIDIDFETVSKTSGPYVKVSGDFINGLKDYDRLYINSTGIYNDKRDTKISNSSIEIENTDSKIEVTNTTIKVNDVKFNLAIDDLSVNNINISEKDDDYRSIYGIVVSSPEDNLEDNKVKVQVPEEKIETSISIY